MAFKKQGSLGRGLGALIASGAAVAPLAKPAEGTAHPMEGGLGTEPSKPDQVPSRDGLRPPLEGIAEGYHSLLVSKIHVNPYQPRREFNLTALQSLKDSIRSEGLLQPISVTPQLDGYQLVAGERRLRACRELGWDRIPARILKTADTNSAILALIENLQREDLTPIEEALGYATLVRDLGLTQEAIAKRLGLKRSSIANSLRLLHLSEEVQGYLSRGLLTAGHAKVLLQLERSGDQLFAARRAVERELSVRDTQALVERLIRQTLTEGKSTDPSLQLSSSERMSLTALQSRLTAVLGTPVQVQQGRYKGRIILEYKDASELEVLVEKLGGSASGGKGRVP